MSSNLLRNAAFFAGLAALSSIARADVGYKVTPSEDRNKLIVEMEFDTSASSVDVQIPSWSPGLHVLQNYWKTLTAVFVADEAGHPLEVSHPRGDTWRVATAGKKHLYVRYERPVNGTMDRLGMFSADDEPIHFSRPFV